MAKNRETEKGFRISHAQNGVQLDAACKRLLSEKEILAHLLKGCVPEFRNLPVRQIASSCIEGDLQVSKIPVLPDEGTPVIRGSQTEDSSINEGTITYDIRFSAVVPNTDEQITLLINVESQNDYYPGYPLLKRAVYYGCRMISSQYGREFSNSHYEKIKKVYSIWICMNPPKKKENTITSYHFAEEAVTGTAAEPASHYDLLQIIMIRLGKPNGNLNLKQNNDILELLNVLFSKEMPPAEKRSVLQESFRLQISDAMEKEMKNMGTFSEAFYERGVSKGIEIGEAKARTEALQEKKNMMRKYIRSIMKAMGCSAKQAADVLEIPESEQEQLISELEASIH